MSTAFHGHERVQARFRQCLAGSRLGNAYLFVGAAGIGKRTFALHLAKALLCETTVAEQLDPCNVCPSCRQVDADTHPDVRTVRQPKDRSVIPIELLIGDREHRNTEGFCHWISLTPHSGRNKIGIIDDADSLSIEGANSLLKTLEEPPARSLIILIATNEHGQLPTIRSRCQIVRFENLPVESLRQVLLQQRLCDDETTAQLVAQRAHGSLDRARRAMNQDWTQQRSELLEKLAALPDSRWDLSAKVNELLDAAGKDTSVRRIQMRQLLEWALELQQAALRIQVGTTADNDPELATRAAEFATQNRDVEASLERTIDAFGQVDANAVLAGLVESWIDDLSLAATR